MLLLLLLLFSYCCLHNECCLCCLLEPAHCPWYPGEGHDCQHAVQYLDEALYPNKKCIENILEADITGDNIVLLFAEYAQLLIAHPVFHDWSNQGAGTWEEQENLDHIGVEMVMKYYKPNFAQLKAKFPNHNFLKGDESHQQLWVNQKANLQKGLEWQKHGGDGESFNPKCHALYLINEPGHLHAEQRD